MKLFYFVLRAILEFQLECRTERLQTLEFHYNDLIQKHKMCLECMTKQRNDYESLKKKYEIANVMLLRLIFKRLVCVIQSFFVALQNEGKRSELDKAQLEGIFKDQIDDLDKSLKQVG